MVIVTTAIAASTPMTMMVMVTAPVTVTVMIQKMISIQVHWNTVEQPTLTVMVVPKMMPCK